MERSRRLIVNREALGFFKAVLESYEEVALMTVLDGRRGEIELTYPEEAETVVESIMADVAGRGVLFREAEDVR